MVRGGQDVLLQRGTLQIELATSEDHATDLIQAHLIETLSAMGREMIDFYYLRIRRNLEEYQINGALAALEHAKQEGYIRFLGLMADGPAMAVLGFWQFHDGFDSVMIPRPVHSSRSLENLEPLAHKRRVGVVLTDCLNIAGVPLSWLKPELELPLMALRQRKHKVITEIRNLHDVALLTAWRDGEVSTTDLEIESELSRLVERVQSPEFLAEIAEVRAPWASVLRANRLKSG
jgi:aryl-alcohol dehydrogenase-like predicted oxidoreductase